MVARRERVSATAASASAQTMKWAMIIPRRFQLVSGARDLIGCADWLVLHARHCDNCSSGGLLALGDRYVGLGFGRFEDER